MLLSNASVTAVNPCLSVKEPIEGVSSAAGRMGIHVLVHLGHRVEQALAHPATIPRARVAETERKLRADLGVTFGDAGGPETNLRSHRSNQSTGLGDDLPGEIMLTPAPWGEVNIR